MIEGWALHAAATESNGWMQFCGVKRSSKGYVAQEIDDMIKQLPK